jgi:tetratricopeptide (TPR) repeat protein
MAAYYLFVVWDPLHADTECRRAIQLDSGIAEEYFLHAFILLSLNRADEAVAEERRAMALNPYERLWGLGYIYLLAHRFDDALAELRMRADMAPTDATLRFFISDTYSYKRMPEESQRELEQALRLQSPEKLEGAHHAYLQGGEPAVQRWKISQALKESSQAYLSAHYFAKLYAAAGDREKTLQFLETGYHNHDGGMILLQVQPEFDFVRHEPRYQAIVRGMGLQLPSDSPK